MKEQGTLSRRGIPLSPSWGYTKYMNLLRKFKNKEPFLRPSWKGALKTHWNGLRALWKGNSSCCVLFLKVCVCKGNQQDQNLKKFLQSKANLLPCWDSSNHGKNSQRCTDPHTSKLPKAKSETCWYSFAVDAFTAWNLNCSLSCHGDESICYFLQLQRYMFRDLAGNWDHCWQFPPLAYHR